MIILIEPSIKKALISFKIIFLLNGMHLENLSVLVYFQSSDSLPGYPISMKLLFALF